MLCRRLVLLALALAFGMPVAASADGGAGDWQATALDLPAAWQLMRGGPSAVVAVVDSGVDSSDPALSGRVLPGYDAVREDTDTADDNGHGTAVARIVASVCPSCRILPVKVLDADLTGEWPTIAEGITWAADHGADVVNLSVGSPGAIDSVGAAVAYALAKGVIVVAAAGNAGTGQTFYPAAYPGVVSVAGVDATTARYPWSDFGSWVSVAAPGCVGDFCGTSTAAPFVAGIAGLARSLDPHLLPSTFSTALAASTTPLSDPTTAAAGLPDAGRLLAALAASTTPTPDPTTAAAALPDARRLLAAHRVRSSGYRLPAPLRDSRRPAPALR